MKKLSFGIALALALAGIPRLSPAADSNEAAIQELNRDFVAAWNAHDAKSMAAGWAEDVSVINPFGVKCSSRAEAQKLFASEQAGVMRASTYRIDSFTLRKACDDVMVGDWESTVTGMIDPSGKTMPPFPHHVTVVYQNRGGHWTVILVRGFATLPPPPPK